MKRILSIVSIVPAAVILASLAAAAQDKPDFTGTWKLSGEAPTPFTPTQIVITKDATLLTVTTTGEMGEFRTNYKLDGTPGPSPMEFQGNRIDRTTRATWNESRLTLSSTSDMNGQTLEFKSVLSRGADGTMIIETTVPDFQGGGAPITTKATYKKAQ